MADSVNVSINTNGLGTVYDLKTYSAYCEFWFIPNDNTRIDYKWKYVCDVTYSNGNDPEHWTGEVRWGYRSDIGRYCLYDQYAWGSSRYMESVTMVITVTGTADAMPHAVVPAEGGVFDGFWSKRSGTELSDGVVYFWNAHTLGQYEIDSLIIYYESVEDGSLLSTTHSFSYYSTPILSAWGDIVRNDWIDPSQTYNDYRKLRGVELSVRIPHISVTLDVQDEEYLPADPFSPSCVYIRSKQGDTYGELPTPTRSGYTFEGWYTARSGRRMRGPVQADWPLSTFYDHTLYAIWTAKPTKTTVSIYDAKNDKWLSGGSSTIACYSYPNLSAVEETPHHLSSYTRSTGYDIYVYVQGESTNYTALCLLGTGVWNWSVSGHYEQISTDTPYCLEYLDTGGWVYPSENFDLTAYVWPKRTLTYLPMYLSANGLLLRGVRSVLPIRDA